MNGEEIFADREELILRAALVFGRMMELAKKPNRNREEWKKNRAETQALEQKWKLLVKQISGSS